MTILMPEPRGTQRDGVHPPRDRKAIRYRVFSTGGRSLAFLRNKQELSIDEIAARSGFGTRSTLEDRRDDGGARAADRRLLNSDERPFDSNECSLNLNQSSLNLNDSPFEPDRRLVNSNDGSFNSNETSFNLNDSRFSRAGDA